jgi:hypothetical protein
MNNFVTEIVVPSQGTLELANAKQANVTYIGPFSSSYSTGIGEPGLSISGHMLESSDDIETDEPSTFRSNDRRATQSYTRIERETEIKFKAYLGDDKKSPQNNT